MKLNEKPSPRRQPRQDRSRQTVEAVLGAVPRVLARHGADGVTTNRIAEIAGVSIGSLYQYFPDKRAIFEALHDRHVDEVRTVIAATINDCRSTEFTTFTSELVDRLTAVHAEKAELHELISESAAGAADGFERALHVAFEHALSDERQDKYTTEQAGRLLFALPRLVDASVHGVAHHTQARCRGQARSEAIRTIGAYLRAYEQRALTAP